MIFMLIRLYSGGRGGNGGGIIKLTASRSIVVSGGIYADGDAGKGDTSPDNGHR